MTEDQLKILLILESQFKEIKDLIDKESGFSNLTCVRNMKHGVDFCISCVRDIIDKKSGGKKEEKNETV